MIVHFKSEEHSFLSNFYPVWIEFRSDIYASVEHAYMSAKSEDKTWKEFCLMEPAGRVKRESRKILLVPDWDSIKIEVMTECVTKKFNVEPLRSMLLNTGSQNIQEGNWHNDTFWGVDLKSNPNVGENHLGRILMNVCRELEMRTI